MDRLSRRDALKMGLLALTGLAWRPLARWMWPGSGSHPAPFAPLGFGRVTVGHIPLRADPSPDAPQVGVLTRDRLLPILEERESPAGPHHNPRWYRTLGGYVHSAYVQRVNFRPQYGPPPPLAEGGQPAEVVVPYTQAYRYRRNKPWSRLYRLYYGSLHWVVDAFRTANGTWWYLILDDILQVTYAVPAAHLRPLQREELSPIHPDVPPEEKRLVVSLAEQTVTAYEGDQAVFHTRIASGIPSDKPTANGIPTRTPSGRFRIRIKTILRHMGNGDLVSALEAYELPGVPWVSFFHPTGVAFHGTYWHDNFGTPMSHGCVNMRIEEARWLFRWTTPVVEAFDLVTMGYGTEVIVQ